MPYFLVLPLFLLAVLGFVTLTVVCAAVSSLKPGLPYAWRIGVGACCGCLLANIPVFALYFVPVALQAMDAHPEPGTARNGVAIAFVAALLVGPFVASALGFLGGAWVGYAAARRLGRGAITASGTGTSGEHGVTSEPPAP